MKTSFFARLSHSRHTFINERKELQICNSQLSCMLLMKVYKNVLGQAYLSVKLPTVVVAGGCRATESSKCEETVLPCRWRHCTVLLGRHVRPLGLSFLHKSHLLAWERGRLLKYVLKLVLYLFNSVGGSYTF